MGKRTGWRRCLNFFSGGECNGCATFGVGAWEGCWAKDLARKLQIFLQHEVAGEGLVCSSWEQITRGGARTSCRVLSREGAWPRRCGRESKASSRGFRPKSACQISSSRGTPQVRLRELSLAHIPVGSGAVPYCASPREELIWQTLLGLRSNRLVVCALQQACRVFGVELATQPTQRGLAGPAVRALAS